MATLYANNASSTLASSALATDTTLALASAATFAAPTGGNLAYATLDSGGTSPPREIVSYTGVSANSLTGVTRGLEGTTAQAWSAGTAVEMRLTAGMLTALQAAPAAAVAGITPASIGAYAQPTRTAFGDASATIAAGTRTVALTAAFTAPRTLTLPAASSQPVGQPLFVVDEVGVVTSANPLTLAAAGTDTLNGVASATYASGRPVLELFSDNVSKWSVGVRPIAAGGTGGTTAAQARTNLGAAGLADTNSFTAQNTFVSPNNSTAATVAKWSAAPTATSNLSEWRDATGVVRLACSTDAGSTAVYLNWPATGVSFFSNVSGIIGFNGTLDGGGIATAYGLVALGKFGGRNIGLNTQGAAGIGVLALPASASTHGVESRALASQAVGTYTFRVTTSSGVLLSGVDQATGAVKLLAVPTGSRPAATTAAGLMVYDTTLSKPIWSDGATWRDATGAAV